MKKLFLIVLATLFVSPVFAQSGIFMDPERIGEGITVFEHERLDKTTAVTFYFYTYQSHIYKDVIDGRQRWLLGSDEFDPKMQQTRGWLYQTHGTNYPEGIPSSEPFEPLAVTVGKTFVVGIYTLRKSELGGWKLWVTPADDDDVGIDGDVPPQVGPLPPEPKDPDLDYLYNRTFWFTYPLVELD